jgi:hypothetical protein
VEGVVAPGITEQRQKDRRELLHQLDTLDHRPCPTIRKSRRRHQAENRLTT